MLSDAHAQYVAGGLLASHASPVRKAYGLHCKLYRAALDCANTLTSCHLHCHLTDMFKHACAGCCKQRYQAGKYLVRRQPSTTSQDM